MANAREEYGQRCWVLSSDRVELCLTQRGGMMAPVRFDIGGDRRVEPYYVSPWQGEAAIDGESVLNALRGDFFCMPFGAPSSYRGVDFPAHGETASLQWEEAEHEERGPIATLQARLRTRLHPATVTKRIQLVAGQSAVYVSHEISGGEGPVSLGHHATLGCSDDTFEWRISTSPVAFGMTDPGLPWFQDGDMYYSLRPRQYFGDLRYVPTVWRDEPTTDCSRFPARPGFVDHLQLYAAQGPEKDRSPAWTAAVNVRRGYLWFSLKDSAVLPATLVWMDNRGRRDYPWNGRNRALGLEEVCGYFAAGLRASAEDNLLNRLGVPTAHTLDPDAPSVVRSVQGVAPVPEGFDRVARVRMEDDAILFTAESGSETYTRVYPDFVRSGILPVGDS